MKHTPGPWVRSERIKQAGKVDFIRVGRPDYDVARVICYGENAELNADLISAAPELLEAARAVLARYRSGRDMFQLSQGDVQNTSVAAWIENLDYAIPHLEAAAAKAEGRE